MSEKRFIIVGEEYVGYTQGNAYIISNGELEFSLWERKEDAQKVCDYLNELSEENEQLRIVLKERQYKKDTALYDLVNSLTVENRELRQKLNDCEKFRHSVFKRMNELTDQLKEKEEDEKLYAQEIVELNKTKKELIEFNELGGDY